MPNEPKNLLPHPPYPPSRYNQQEQVPIFEQDHRTSYRGQGLRDSILEPTTSQEEVCLVTRSWTGPTTPSIMLWNDNMCTPKSSGSLSTVCVTANHLKSSGYHFWCGRNKLTIRICSSSFDGGLLEIVGISSFSSGSPFSDLSYVC